LRLRGINDLASANAYLPAFMADFNPRFAVTASPSLSSHPPSSAQQPRLSAAAGRVAQTGSMA
jgi:hypothetical protein